jgi:hypothetical protein
MEIDVFCGVANMFSYCLLTVFCRRFCLVLGKWLISPMYGGAECPWRLMVGVNDLLYVALECLCISVNWKGIL